MQTLTQVGLVAMGSALGGLTRWGLNVASLRWFAATAFPVGTFVINVTGSLFLGWFITAMSKQLALPGAPTHRIENLYLLIAVGFTGSYTTFSTFEFETHKLLADGNTLMSAAYVALSVFLGLLAVRFGVWLAGT